MSTDIVEVVSPVDHTLLPPALDVTVSCDVSPGQISLSVDVTESTGAVLGADMFFVT